MVWDDPNYAGKVEKLHRLFRRSGHGLVRDHIDRLYTVPVPDEGFTKAELFHGILEREDNASIAAYLEAKLGKLRHLRDKRDPYRYACDLVTGWLLEDLILLVLQDHGLRPELSGEDRRREFLKRPTEAPDLRFQVGSRSYLLDVMKSDRDTWVKTRKLHLRDDKFFRMRDREAFLVAVDLFAWQLAVLDITRCQTKHIPSHWPYGNKPAQEISLKETPFFPMEDLNPVLAESLEAAVKARA